MAGIPTWYGGIEFRSRLEARWAAFFDLLGWRWEYEPFDLDGYIPDFLLPDFKTKVIVEVKPAISDAAKKKIERSGWEHEAVVVGNAPSLNAYGGGWALGELGRIGGCIRDTPIWAWRDALLSCGSDEAQCFYRFGLTAIDDTNCRRCHADGTGTPTTADVEMLWREACNATKWAPSSVASTLRLKRASTGEPCTLCGATVYNDNLGGYGRNSARQRVYYCQRCVNRLADEAYEAGHR